MADRKNTINNILLTSAVVLCGIGFLVIYVIPEIIVIEMLEVYYSYLKE